MRLRCLALSLLFGMPYGYAEENDPLDPALHTCIQSLYKKNNWQSAQDVTEIRCHKKNIRSLKGIAQFTNLEALSVYNNKITEVALSELKKLKVLNLARNDITKLDLASLPELDKLYVFSNKIAHITLTDFPKLKLVKANANRMQKFLYKNLPKLEKIYIFNNEIEHIDIYSLPSVKYIDCRQNPMSDELYEEMDAIKTATILHDGNADDW